ncbi:MAG: ParB/RepB/Spo0J family partition protein [bacterium]|nr:ParB/RepB/Spo0J family partition protein [bacterium]
MQLQEINLDRIVSDPKNPRTELSNLDSLEASIRSLREQKLGVYKSGIMQPILVREFADGFMIIAGHRRVAASRQAGLTSIPAFIASENSGVENSKYVLAQQIIENSQREGVNPLDTARAISRFVEEFKMQRQEVAKLLGMSNSSITGYLNQLDSDLVPYLPMLGGHRTLLAEVKNGAFTFDDKELMKQAFESSGTAYSLNEMRRLQQWCKENKNVEKLTLDLIPAIRSGRYEKKVNPAKLSPQQPVRPISQAVPVTIVNASQTSDNDAYSATAFMKAAGRLDTSTVTAAPTKTFVEIPATRISTDTAHLLLTALGDHKYVRPGELQIRLLAALQRELTPAQLSALKAEADMLATIHESQVGGSEKKKRKSPEIL